MNITFLSRRLTLLAFGFSLLAPVQLLRGATPAETRAAIQALEKKYDEAFNKGDAAAMGSLYLDDAQLLTSDQNTVKGRKAIEKFWKADMKAAAAEGTKVASKPVEIEQHGGVAHETGVWVLKKPDGTKTYEGKYLVIWKLRAGQWKIYREIWNTKK